jgi:DNA polymerase
VGNPDSPLVFLGEAPGMDEDKQGEPFVGRAGQLLTDIITKGMKIRREDVYICNILRCRPPGNRNPMPDEAAHCRPFLDRTLEIIQPKFICCLGAVAAKNLLASEQTIGAMRGKVFDYNGIKVVCTYHPAYLLRNPAAKKDTWEDIQLLMREMETHKN